MVMTMPPNLPGSQRIVPLHPTATELDNLRRMLDQGDWWVTRHAWRRWLAEGSAALTTPIDRLGRDQRVAAHSWVSQQRHYLYRALEDPTGVAPDSWLESLPLAKALLAD
jgi:hypothetical protein